MIYPRLFKPMTWPKWRSFGKILFGSSSMAMSVMFASTAGTKGKFVNPYLDWKGEKFEKDGGRKHLGWLAEASKNNDEI